MANRPEVLRWFGWLMLATVAFNTLALLLFSSDIRADAIARRHYAEGWLVDIALTACSNLLFWWRIARRAGNLARWAYLGLAALSLLQLPNVLARTERFGMIFGALMLVGFAASLASATLLLRKDVGRWLRSGGREGRIGPTVFE